jgi:phosphoenolpyruvate-protein phosphotransferase (PTS system enzyme I)
VQLTIHGIPVSPGIAIGPTVAFGVHALEVPRYAITDPDLELARFERARSAVRQEYTALRERLSHELTATDVAILDAHLMFVDDVAWDEVVRRMREERVNAEQLVEDTLKRYTALMKEAGDASFRERAKDFEDVGTRLLSQLLGTELESLEKLDRPSVVVAHDLSPADTAKLDRKNALGIATDVSGPTSHTAIFARAFEIPAVVGLRHLGAHIVPGEMIIVDGTRGHVIVRPTEETLEQFRREKLEEEEKRHVLIEAEAGRPSVTRDGFAVPVLANIELPEEIAHSKRAHADGIGLYRTEYLFLNRDSIPAEDEQYEAYAHLAEAMAPAPVTLRTLDIGGDKFVSHLQIAEEINPQMGWRAVRFCLERPDIFKAQLRAIFRASVHGNVRIMFPMISGVGELRQVKAVVEEVRGDLKRRGVPFDESAAIGTMIEVPSAVIVADALARECDFFSIGTNDLIQYSLAVDRVNEKIAHMYEPSHPAVIRMIAQTVQAAKDAGIPCGICGEMAGQWLYTELLVGLGVDSLSMSAVSIPMVRAAVQSSRRAQARTFAKKVLEASSVQEVKVALQSRAKRRRALDAYLKELV